jgi:tetratricopeptide (TPR) repeat protein
MGQKTILGIAGIAILAGLLASPAVVAATPEDTLKEGVAAFQRGDYPTALEAFEWLHQQHPQFVPARLLLAQTLFRTGQVETGLQHLLVAEALDARDQYEDFYTMAWLELLRTTSDPALKSRAARALKSQQQKKIFSGRGQPDPILMGQIHQLAGNPRAALASFREAIREDPVDWVPRFYEGHALMELQRFPDAERSYKVVLERCGEGCPKEPIWRALGSLYERWDRPDLALAAYLEAGDDKAVERVKKQLIES